MTRWWVARSNAVSKPNKNASTCEDVLEMFMREKGWKQSLEEKSERDELTPVLGVHLMCGDLLLEGLSYKVREMKRENVKRGCTCGP